MTKQYFFILGRNPDLSLAEILTCLQTSKINYQVIVANQEVFICQSDEIDKDWFDRLGGSKKYGQIFFQTDKLDFAPVRKFFNDCPKGQKFNFGFSFYNLEKSALKKAQPIFYRQGLTYKKELKAEGVRSRMVQTREADLSSVVVHKEKMIEQGADAVIVQNNNSYYYGRTLAVQDYDSFSARDYGKPARDTYSGLLPLKLARIMINLAGQELDSFILDPSCGSGTVLLEALAMGYKVMGIDRNQSAIDNTHNNLIWFQQHYSLEQMPIVKLGRVEDLIPRLDPDSVDAIVTEPYLGPGLRKNINQQDLQMVRSELEKLYSQSLAQFSKILKPGGRVVMIWPVFIDSFEQANYLKVIVPKNFQRFNVVSKSLPEFDWSTKGRSSYLYSRVNQKVWREILVWEKK